MKKVVSCIFLLLLGMFFMVGGCSVVESRVARWTTDFNTLTSDSRILYEDGAEKLAEESALCLDKAIKNVELKQQGDFTEPVRVYVFATPESFSRFSGVSAKARGAAVGNEIYLSSLLNDLPKEVYGMIGHELSHVQLSQNLGIITFNRSLPRWFREGLAIYVSDGGGAPRNYDQEAIEKFLEGEHFTPETKGTLFNISLKATADIGPRMYYSQSGMFVEYLATTYPEEFGQLLNGLQRGQQFHKTFTDAFHEDIDMVLTSYITGLKNG